MDAKDVRIEVSTYDHKHMRARIYHKEKLIETMIDQDEIFADRVRQRVEEIVRAMQFNQAERELKARNAIKQFAEVIE